MESFGSRVGDKSEDWDQATTELGELGERYLHERLWTFVAMELAPRLARQDVVRLAGDWER